MEEDPASTFLFKRKLRKDGPSTSPEAAGLTSLMVISYKLMVRKSLLVKTSSQFKTQQLRVYSYSIYEGRSN